MKKQEPSNERRKKQRFAMERDVRFKVVMGDQVLLIGVGRTVNLSSGGVAFENSTKSPIPVEPGTLLEVSISWPVLLEQTCIMQLVVGGPVVRTRRNLVVCRIERYEFRTQAKSTQANWATGAREYAGSWAGTPARELKAAAARM